MGTTTRHKVHRRSLGWIAMAVLILVLDRMLPDAFWDATYYKGLYQGIRVFYGLAWGWSPVPMAYVLLAVIVFRMVVWMRNRTHGAVYMASQAIGGIALLVALFYLLWAFNYHQPSLKQVIGADEHSVDEGDIYQEFLAASNDLRDAANALPADLQRDASIAAYGVKDYGLRPWVKSALQDLQLPNKGNVRVRQLWPKGTLLHWSTAGIYIPQTGEGHVDAGLLSVQKPFTMAHEMAHGYGVTDEGDCNFIAWLACRQATDPWTRYGGAYTYWRYAAAEMPRDTVSAMLDSLPAVVKRTLELVRINDRKYPDWMPRIRDAIYSNYLKRHGVSKGLRSYNDVVILARHYRQLKGWK